MNRLKQLLLEKPSKKVDAFLKSEEAPSKETIYELLKEGFLEEVNGKYRVKMSHYRINKQKTKEKLVREFAKTQSVVSDELKSDLIPTDKRELLELCEEMEINPVRK